MLLVHRCGQGNSPSTPMCCMCVVWAQTTKDKSLEDIFYEKDVQNFELAFESQMHFGQSSRSVKATVTKGAIRVCRWSTLEWQSVIGVG